MHCYNQSLFRWYLEQISEINDQINRPNMKGQNLFEVPTENDVFFSAASCKKDILFGGHFKHTNIKVKKVNKLLPSFWDENEILKSEGTY